nr:hypothetical protein [Tanacetum cinerariifolium]GFB93047.1 hypothetical protein [Tanacetum cinerariifolium]
MDLFNLIRAPNPTKVKTGSRPCAPHEVSLLTLTATRVIEMDDPAAATDSSGDCRPRDVVVLEMPSSKDVPATDVPGAGQAEETAATDPPAALESRKRGRDGTDVNAPPKSLRRDHANPHAPAGVSDPDPLSFADPPSRHPADVTQSSQGTAVARDPESENASSLVEVGSPDSGNGITTAFEIRTGGKAAEEVRCSGGSLRQKDSGPRARNKKPGSITGGRDEYEESRERQEC